MAIPTVYLRETVASPCKNKEADSNPLAEVEVTFSLKITGPSNSERILLSGPPSTLRPRPIVISYGVRISNPSSNPDVISSPVTVGTGASNTSSRPVEELTFLLPM